MKENYWIRNEGIESESFGERQPQERPKDKQHQDPKQQEYNKQQYWRKPIAQLKTCQVAQKNENNNNNPQVNDEGRQDEAGAQLRTSVAAEVASANQALRERRSSGLLRNKQVESEHRRPPPGSSLPAISVQQASPPSTPLPSSPPIKPNDNDVNLSFCGCGFLGIYHVGVASCFHEYAPQLSMHKISGSSAGALVAVAHICGNLQLAYATTDILRVAIDARSRALGPFHPSFDINATVREALERGLPDDVHIKASGKLHVSLTRVYDGQNVIVSQFNSKEEVIQVLICSCFIPFWSGLKAPKFRGVTYIDGGFSNNLLVLDAKTVTVSPFAGEADICPQDDTFNLLQVNLSNTSFSLTPDNLYRLSHALLPPKPEVLSDLCEQGFADGIRFLQRMKLISCNKCLEIRSSLLVTENGEDMEEAVTQQVTQTDELMVGNFSSFSCSQAGDTASIGSHSDSGSNHHIRLEQQEQKMIEINGSRTRRDSVVSTSSSQVHQHHLATSTAATTTVAGSHKASELAGLDATTKTKTTAYTVTKPTPDVTELQDGRLQVNCDQCRIIRQKALCGPLPKQFSDRIRAACDTVNKSLSNWIYSHRPIKYLSYLAAPYYLPVDISLALIFKCWQSLPFIRSEIVDCVYNIVEFLIGIVKRMNSSSTTSKLMMSACNWEKEAFAYEKEVIRHQQQQQQQQSCAPLTASGASSLPPVSNLTSTTTTTTTTSTSVESSFSLKITTDGLYVSKRKNSRSVTSTSQLHSLEDTFDSIVDVTSNQEARIFAYYFRDAKNRLQVTEIFDFQRAAELSSASSTTSTTTTTTSPASQLTGSLPLPQPPQHQQQLKATTATLTTLPATR